MFEKFEILKLGIYIFVLLFPKEFAGPHLAGG
jgi:hypothetical protein